MAARCCELWRLRRACSLPVTDRLALTPGALGAPRTFVFLGLAEGDLLRDLLREPDFFGGIVLLRVL